MDFKFLYRIFVVLLCLDVTIGAAVKNEDNTQNGDKNTESTLRRICLQEMGEPPNVSIPKLGAFKLGELLKCMDIKYESQKRRLPSGNQTYDARMDEMEKELAKLKVISGLRVVRDVAKSLKTGEIEEWTPKDVRVTDNNDLESHLQGLKDMGNKNAHPLNGHTDPDDTFVEENVNALFEGYDYLYDHLDKDVVKFLNEMITDKKAFAVLRDNEQNF